MTTLIIGAGLVGSQIARLLAEKGERPVLMDRAPRTPTEAIERAAASAPGVTETRRVRVRSGGDKLFADVTVAAGRTTSLERAHDIAESVETAIEAVAPGTDVVVHVEPHTAERGKAQSTV